MALTSQNLLLQAHKHKLCVVILYLSSSNQIELTHINSSLLKLLRGESRIVRIARDLVFTTPRVRLYAEELVLFMRCYDESLGQRT